MWYVFSDCAPEWKVVVCRIVGSVVAGCVCVCVCGKESLDDDESRLSDVFGPTRRYGDR